jgi:alpha-L-rhamnosidase
MKIDRIKHLHFPGMANINGARPAAVTITNPRCEYPANPVGIDALSPRLSWTLASEQRGERQTAYQVLVASPADLLSTDTGDLWNRRKVVSDESAQIAVKP